MKHNTLWEAQVSAYPDSLRLTDTQMLEALRTAIPDWVAEHKFEDWRHYDARHEMGWYASIGYENWKQLEIEMTRARWARNAFLYRTQNAQGFFYACVKRPDGTYRYIGFRDGFEEQDYASGFDGMEYTPQGETK
jgi:hypothetical protein